MLNHLFVLFSDEPNIELYEAPKLHTNDSTALLAKPSTSRPQVSNIKKVVEKVKDVAESSSVTGLSRHDTTRKDMKVKSYLMKFKTILQL
jgi:hypothetical protein